jgi:hypothetical protein
MSLLESGIVVSSEIGTDASRSGRVKGEIHYVRSIPPFSSIYVIPLTRGIKFISMLTKRGEGTGGNDQLVQLQSLSHHD